MAAQAAATGPETTPAAVTHLATHLAEGASSTHLATPLSATHLTAPPTNLAASPIQSTAHIAATNLAAASPTANLTDKTRQTNYATIIQTLKNDLLNPIAPQKLVSNRLPNIGLTAIPSLGQNGIRLQFKTKEDKKKRFNNKFSAKDFGPQAKLINLDAQKQEANKPTSKPTFTCVIKSIPTTISTEELKPYFKTENIHITNATRIRNDKGPHPLVRLFTTDPALVSTLITNGLTIGYTRYRVEESKSASRPLPCRTCLLYHDTNMLQMWGGPFQLNMQYGPEQELLWLVQS